MTNDKALVLINVPKALFSEEPLFPDEAFVFTDEESLSIFVKARYEVTDENVTTLVKNQALHLPGRSIFLEYCYVNLKR
jgi:hypothetical protein